MSAGAGAREDVARGLPEPEWCVAWVYANSLTIIDCGKSEKRSGGYVATFQFDDAKDHPVADQAAWEKYASMVCIPRNAASIYIKLYGCNRRHLIPTLAPDKPAPTDTAVLEELLRAPEKLSAGFREFCRLNGPRIRPWTLLHHSRPDGLGPMRVRLEDIGESGMPRASIAYWFVRYMHQDRFGELAFTTEMASLIAVNMENLYIQRLPDPPRGSRNSFLYDEDIESVQPGSLMTNHALDYINEMAEDSPAGRTVTDVRLVQSTFMTVIVMPPREGHVAIDQLYNPSYEQVYALVKRQYNERRGWLVDKRGLSKLRFTDFILFPILSQGHWILAVAREPYSASNTPLITFFDSAESYIPDRVKATYAMIITAVLSLHGAEHPDLHHGGVVLAGRGWIPARVPQQSAPMCGSFVTCRVQSFLTRPGVCREACDGAIAGHMVLRGQTQQMVRQYSTKLHQFLLGQRESAQKLAIKNDASSDFIELVE